MLIRDLFLKPIDRTIEGVIKADDLESLKTEVEEFVITNEIARNLSYLFDQYNKTRQTSNGVWISGFFGSGKSHLLKMLALLLENTPINGMSVLDTLLEKVPASDALLKAEMRKAAALPSQSILFNIDQKADAINKTQSDAVLGVFAKVFDEFCGYYGQQGYIAKFERDLDGQGLYDQFKQIFQEVSGLSWHEGRENFNLNRINISKAYAMLTNNSADSSQDIIKSYREDYHLSIEDFANNVNKYIQEQDKNFQLNFFVDEVGQYVAENVKLMTNLQTIAESLATICKGKAWLFVTSQDDMTTVLGEFGKSQSNDFSKIQARFKIQIHLTSQDVSEVIQKRLLKKNAAGELIIRKLYINEKPNFGTLFAFPDGGMNFQNFKDEEDFVSSYPFIPYQYTMFQQSIESLSQHNAFTGKHNSVGERSMLGVFQDVVKEIGDKESGAMGSFDLMFEGIRSALKARVYASIQTAENHLNDPLAIRILKALFMVKYVKSYRATSRNLRVLMQTGFNEDIKDLQERINNALAKLERETYIQRNDDVYEYLTEEEHDIETEIKNVSVDNEEILKTLEDLFFAGIIQDTKIRFADNQQDYGFAKRINESLRGKDRELSIDFITPFYEYGDNINLLKAHSMGKAELKVVLPADDQFMHDVLMYKKTESYVKQNHGLQISETRKMILTNKSYQNAERKKAIANQVQELVREARFIISGDEINLNKEEAKTMIIKAFNALIAKIYPHLRMLGNVQYSENDIRHYLESGQDSLFNQEAIPLNEAELEMITFVQANQRNGERTTMKRIDEKFSTRPYGWYLAANQCVLASLVARKRVECWLDGTLLENGPLEKALKNTYGYSNLIVEPVKTVSPVVIESLKRFYSGFFNKPISENDARSLVKSIKSDFLALKDKLVEYHHYHNHYPFLSRLKPLTEKMDLFAKNDFDFFINDLSDHEDEWLDLKEDEIDPLLQFMTGPKREIYDNLLDFSNQKKPDMPAKDIETLNQYLKDATIFAGNKLQQARIDLEDIKERLRKSLEKERQKALDHLNSLQEDLQSHTEYQQLKEEDQNKLDQSFRQIEYTIKQQALAVSIRDKAEEYEVNQYPQVLTTMIELASPVTTDKPEIKPVYIHVSEIKIQVNLKTLETPEDVLAYSQALEKALLEAIHENKRINI